MKSALIRQLEGDERLRPVHGPSVEVQALILCSEAHLIGLPAVDLTDLRHRIRCGPVAWLSMANSGPQIGCR